jgi:hypothetical protein
MISKQSEKRCKGYLIADEGGLTRVQGLFLGTSHLPRY